MARTRKKEKVTAETTSRSGLGLNEKLMVFIVLASEIFKKRSSAIFRENGLTFSHYSVLKHLVACEDGRDTVGNVSKGMLVTGPSVTGLAKRMEKAGLIERRNDANDERLTILQITPKGLTTLDTIREIQENHVSRYLDGLPEDRKQEILSLLKQIVRQGKQP